MFKLHSDFKPTGDQPEAISDLTGWVGEGKKHQVLLGVTGSGKSLTRDQPVLIKVNGQTKLLEIGDLIDSYFWEVPHALSKPHYETEIVDMSYIRDSLEVLSWNPLSGQTEYKRITHLTRHISPKECYTVYTKCGRTVTVTGDHNFWVLRKGSLRLIKPNEASPGDYIPLPIKIEAPCTPLRGIHTWQYLSYKTFCCINDLYKQNNPIADGAVRYVLGTEKYWRVVNRDEEVPFGAVQRLLTIVEESVPLYRPRGNPIPSYLQVTPSFLTFVGLYVAEGHGSNRYILISVHEKKLKKLLIASAKDLNLRFKERSLNPGDIQISHVLWTDFLSNSCGRNAHDKRLPQWFMELNNKQLAVLLSAYYSDDGWVEDNRVMALTASRSLASDLLYALLRFGIVARLSRKQKHIPGNEKRYGDYYEISISGQNFLRIFADEIGFILERKQKRLLRILGKKHNTNVDIIPMDGGAIRAFRIRSNFLQRDIAEKIGVSRSYISMLENNKHNPSRDVYSKLAQQFPNFSNYSAVGSLNTFWTPIENVVEEKSVGEYVYDFSVEDNETFLAGYGGLFVHNTFTMANVVESVQKPTLVISHNKTLAAQLYQEFRDFFPENAVEYFVSYYDYYQPESYMPQTDTYIEKDADINEEIDKLRLSATTSLMTRKDVIVVASVSCIYNLGSPVEYSKWALELRKDMKIRKQDLLKRLSQIYYERSEFDFKRGTYRVRGDVVDVFPAYQDYAVRVEFLDDKIVGISHFDPMTGSEIDRSRLPNVRTGSHARSITQDEQDYLEHRMTLGGVAMIYPAKHYIAAEERREGALKQIEADLEIRLEQLRSMGKAIEAYRLEQRTRYDLEMMREIGYCKGIENYSRYFDGRRPGEPPYTLMDFFPKDFLTVIDESHITVPQIRGMHNGDRSRKETLIEYGFRLPSALDNRPLDFGEFLRKTNRVIYTSATPSEWELSISAGRITEQLVRPTGIVDPKVTVKPTEGQVEDLLDMVRERVAGGERVLVTTLTKRMAEELASHMLEKGVKVTYLHSDIKTLERTDILDDLRRGQYDVLVGINLLREGLDLPEVSLVAILDADKEGFLRSETSLIQTMGRASRHIRGEIVMYADRLTGSMKAAIDEVDRRRNVQLEYNLAHNASPEKISKPIRKKLIDEVIEKSRQKKGFEEMDYAQLPPSEVNREVKNLEKEMKYEAESLNFERALVLRDKIREMRKYID
ncbi:helix-turn-helix domain-containing protein [candidate division WWE3 bacterium]|nr:helix-turn-helix domain-containing protein [candidate division WWE3 bacterium]